jgi:hypothetical protein
MPLDSGRRPRKMTRAPATLCLSPEAASPSLVTLPNPEVPPGSGRIDHIGEIEEASQTSRNVAGNLENLPTSLLSLQPQFGISTRPAAAGAPFRNRKSSGPTVETTDRNSPSAAPFCDSILVLHLHHPAKAPKAYESLHSTSSLTAEHTVAQDEAGCEGRLHTSLPLTELCHGQTGHIRSRWGTRP